MSVPFPNLFLVGAMRSGTTALHEALARHPDVFMSPVKEPAYFADPIELASDSRIATAGGFAGNRNKYVDLFTEAGEVRYIGESSTHYTKRPRLGGIVERMASAAPDAHILYVVRDPVERTLSHYRYAVRQKYELRPPLDALRSEPIYCAVSDYAMQVRPYIDVFGADALHIAVFEELIDETSDALCDIYRWLDIELPDEIDLSIERRNQMTEDLNRARGPVALHNLGRSAGYKRIARAIFPESLRAAVRQRLNEPLETSSIRSPEVLDLLRTTHEDHAAALEHILGRRLDRWTTLRPAPT